MLCYTKHKMYVLIVLFSFYVYNIYIYRDLYNQDSNLFMSLAKTDLYMVMLWAGLLCTQIIKSTIQAKHFKPVL